MAAHDKPGLSGRRPLVADMMSRDPLVLRADMRIEPAIALLVDHGYCGAPVVDDSGCLFGMLHALDVAVMHLVDDRPYTPESASPRHTLVGEVCRAAVTIQPNDTAAAAAARMRRHATDRLAVVKPARHVVGVVSGSDLLRTIVRRGDLLSEIVSEKIAALGLPHVQASVDYPGIVLLTGSVDSHEALLAVVRDIGALTGVLEVHELLPVVPEHPKAGTFGRSGGVARPWARRQARPW